MTQTMMKKVLLVASLALLAPLSAAFADVKIAVVSVSRLLEESPQVKSAQKSIQDEFAARQRELVKQQQDLKNKEDKLNRDGAVMAEAERVKAEKDLRDGQRELQRKSNEFGEDLNLRKNEELGKVQRSLLQEVQTFAKANGYDLVVGEGVLYAKDTLDITPQVLAALQQHGLAPAPAAAPAKPAPGAPKSP